MGEEIDEEFDSMLNLRISSNQFPIIDRLVEIFTISGFRVQCPECENIIKWQRLRRPNRSELLRYLLNIAITDTQKLIEAKKYGGSE